MTMTAPALADWRPSDLEPIQTNAAAELVDRTPACIRKWIERGWIRRVRRGRRVARQILVDRGDVLRVDALLAGGKTPPVIVPIGER